MWLSPVVILDRGNAQGTVLPWFTGLGDEPTPRRARSICAGAQFGLKLIEETLFPDFGADASRSHPVDPSGSAASVGGHSSPSVAEHAKVSEPTPHVLPTVVGMRLAPLIEFALNAEYPSLIGWVIRVHRSFPRHASLPSSCSPSPCARLSRAPTTTGAPPSVSSISGRRGEPNSELGRRSEFPRSDP